MLRESYTFSGIASFNGLQELQIAGSVTDKASPGDVNGSGITPDLADAIVVLKVVAGLNPPNVFASADVNGDNRIQGCSILFNSIITENVSYADTIKIKFIRYIFYFIYSENIKSKALQSCKNIRIVSDA